MTGPIRPSQLSLSRRPDRREGQPSLSPATAGMAGSGSPPTPGVSDGGIAEHGAPVQPLLTRREPRVVKGLARVLLALYVSALLWLTLFKLSYDIPTILAEYQTRSMNPIPFVRLGGAGLSETISNFVTFIPFGLLLSVNFKKTARRRLLTVVLVFSVAVESLQFILAIGTTDATDVVTNTLGGLTGLALYRLVNKGIRAEILDWVIAAVGTILFVTLVLLRLLVLRVRY